MNQSKEVEMNIIKYIFGNCDSDKDSLNGEEEELGR